MSRIVAFSVEQKSLYILVPQNRLYHQNTAKLSLKYGVSAPVLNTTVQWVQNFQEQRSVENRARVGRPETSSQEEQNVGNYFNRNPGKSLRTAELYLTVPRSSM